MSALKNLELILVLVRGLFTFRLKGTRGLLYTVKSDFLILQLNASNGSGTTTPTPIPIEFRF